MGDDEVGGGGDVVAAGCGGVVDQSHQLAVGVAVFELLQFAVDFVGVGDSAAGGINFKDNGFDLGVLSGGADLADAVFDRVERAEPAGAHLAGENAAIGNAHDFGGAGTVGMGFAEVGIFIFAFAVAQAAGGFREDADCGQIDEQA